MYGFLRIPQSSSCPEKKEYKKYMCNLCNSLHQNYGIMGRLLTNYDSSTLALMIGGLDGSLSGQLIEPPRRLCFPLLKGRPTSDIFRFIGDVSVMLGYSKALDKKIDDNKRIPKWIDKLADKADRNLSKYGLDKAFFVTALNEQHNLEKESTDLNHLSSPTSSIISGILGASAELVKQTESSLFLKNLGTEIGKLIYAYDGIFDYHSDIKSGSFNCIDYCYVRHNNMDSVSQKVHEFIQTAKTNISTILDKIKFVKYENLIKKVILESPGIKANNENQKTSYKNSCEIFNSGNLTKDAISDILNGSVTTKMLFRSVPGQHRNKDRQQDNRNRKDSCCDGPVIFCCPCDDCCCECGSCTECRACGSLGSCGDLSSCGECGGCCDLASCGDCGGCCCS